MTGSPFLALSSSDTMTTWPESANVPRLAPRMPKSATSLRSPNEYNACGNSIARASASVRALKSPRMIADFLWMSTAVGAGGGVA